MNEDTEQGPYRGIAARLRDRITEVEAEATDPANTDTDAAVYSNYLNGLRNALAIAEAPPGVRWSGTVTDDEVDYVTDDEVAHVRGWAMGMNLRPIFERLVAERTLLAARLANAGRTPIVEYEVTDRGLAYPTPVPAYRGAGQADVHDASLAEVDALWFTVTDPEGDQATVLLDVDGAITLADQIITLARRRGHRLAGEEGAPAEAEAAVAGAPLLSAEALETLADELRTAPAPDAERTEDAIAELSAYLGALIAGNALGDALAGHLARTDLDTTTADMLDQLGKARVAAESAIAGHALGNGRPVFPPSPRHLRNAGARLALLREQAEQIITGVNTVADALGPYLTTVHETTESE